VAQEKVKAIRAESLESDGLPKVVMHQGRMGRNLFGYEINAKHEDGDRRAEQEDEDEGVVVSLRSPADRLEMHLDLQEDDRKENGELQEVDVTIERLCVSEGTGEGLSQHWLYTIQHQHSRRTLLLGFSIGRM
jgi:hypothetical protein